MGEPSLWLAHRLQVVALPGLLLAVVAMFTLRDPPRGLSDGHEAKSAAFGRSCTLHLHKKTLRQLIIGSTLVVTVGYGAIAGCRHISCVLMP